VVAHIEKNLLKNDIFLDKKKIPIALEIILAFYIISLKNHRGTDSISINFFKTHNNYLNIIYYDGLTMDNSESSLQKKCQSLLPASSIFEIISKILDESDIACSVEKTNNLQRYTLPELLNDLNKLDLIKLILNAKLALMRLGGVSFFNSDSTRVQIPLDSLLTKKNIDS